MQERRRGAVFPDHGGGVRYGLRCAGTSSTMAYVYSNALYVSVSLLILGLIQVSLAVSCVFGCHAGYSYTYASPGWSGLLAFLTGVFGICMVCNYKEMKLGKCYLVLSLISLVASAACLFLVAFFAWRAEYSLARDAQERARLAGRSEKLNATGLAIHSCVLCVGLCLLVSAWYAACLNCCCERAPSRKGYGLALGMEPVRVAHGEPPNRRSDGYVTAP